MKLKRFFKWFLILIAAAVGVFVLIAVVETSYRLATARDVTEAEAEKNAREKLREHCEWANRHQEKCDPSKYFVSARMHGKDPTDPQHGAAWIFQYSDSTGAPRHVLHIAVDKSGNPELAGSSVDQTPVSNEISYDTGIR